MWDYAKLSQMANAYGGPEKLLEALTKKGIEIGIKQAKGKYGLILGIGIVGGFVLSGLVFLVVDKYKKGKVMALGSDNAAAQVLIDGINAYDEEVRNNPDKTPLPKISREEAEAQIDEFVQYVADEMKKEKAQKSDDQDETECPNDDKSE